MPTVRLSVFQGQIVQDKPELIQSIADAVAAACEIPADWVAVMIEELAAENWGQGRTPGSNRAPVPLARLSMHAGRGPEKKRAAIQGIAEAVSRACDVPVDGVSVMIEEFAGPDWARATPPSGTG